MIIPMRTGTKSARKIKALKPALRALSKWLNALASIKEVLYIVVLGLGFHGHSFEEAIYHNVAA